MPSILGQRQPPKTFRFGQGGNLNFPKSKAWFWKCFSDLVCNHLNYLNRNHSSQNNKFEFWDASPEVNRGETPRLLSHKLWFYESVQSCSLQLQFFQKIQGSGAWQTHWRDLSIEKIQISRRNRMTILGAIIWKCWPGCAWITELHWWRALQGLGWASVWPRGSVAINIHGRWGAIAKRKQSSGSCALEIHFI